MENRLRVAIETYLYICNPYLAWDQTYPKRRHILKWQSCNFMWNIMWPGSWIWHSLQLMVIGSGHLPTFQDLSKLDEKDGNSIMAFLIHFYANCV